MKKILMSIAISLLWSPLLAHAQFTPRARIVSVCSSTQGTQLVGAIHQSLIVNVLTGAATGICVARLNGDCVNLTQCIGAPIAAGSGVSFLGKEDGDGQYCGILATGSTCVSVGINEK